MTAMLEQAAEAAWREANAHIPESVRLKDWSLFPEEGKDNFRRFVRAVLTSIRKPDEALLEGVAGTIEWGGLTSYQCVIDAILAEKPE